MKVMIESLGSDSQKQIFIQFNSLPSKFSGKSTNYRFCHVQRLEKLDTVSPHDRHKCCANWEQLPEMDSLKRRGAIGENKFVNHYPLCIKTKSALT